MSNKQSFSSTIQSKVVKKGLFLSAFLEKFVLINAVCDLINLYFHGVLLGCMGVVFSLCFFAFVGF